MSKVREISKEETVQDLWQTLVEFWLGLVEDSEAESAVRMKASEYLAKYILEAGKSFVKRRGQSNTRPSTAEILRLAASLEKNSE